MENEHLVTMTIGISKTMTLEKLNDIMKQIMDMTEYDAVFKIELKTPIERILCKVDKGVK